MAAMKRRMTVNQAARAATLGMPISSYGTASREYAYVGSKKFLETKKQINALTLFMLLGHPDWFITVTFHAHCEDMVVAADGRQFNHMEAEMTRLQHMQREQFRKEIEDGYFGKCLTIMDCNEYQKRDTPHFHMLLALDKSDPTNELTHTKLIEASRATLPNPFRDPELAAVIYRCGIHTCMQRCRKEGQPCRYALSYPFRNNLEVDGGKYPQVPRPKATAA